MTSMKWLKSRHRTKKPEQVLPQGSRKQGTESRDGSQDRKFLPLPVLTPSQTFTPVIISSCNPFCRLVLLSVLTAPSTKPCIQLAGRCICHNTILALIPYDLAVPANTITELTPQFQIPRGECMGTQLE